MKSVLYCYERMYILFAVLRSIVIQRGYSLESIALDGSFECTIDVGVYPVTKARLKGVCNEV